MGLKQFKPRSPRFFLPSVQGSSKTLRGSKHGRDQAGEAPQGSGAAKEEGREEGPGPIDYRLYNREYLGPRAVA